MRRLRLGKETLGVLGPDELRGVLAAGTPTPTHGCTVYPTYADVTGCLEDRTLWSCIDTD